MQRCHLNPGVVARLDRAIQYGETPAVDRDITAYWIVPLSRRMTLT